MHPSLDSSDDILNLESQQRKILYEKKLSEDNYTDESFLKTLLMKRPPKPFTYLQGVTESTQIALGVSNVAYYLWVFHILHADVQDRNLARLALLLIVTVGLSAGIIYLLFEPRLVKLKKFLQNVVAMTLILVLVYFCSPIFMTNYVTMQDEAVYWIAGFLIAFHLYFRDYSYDKDTSFEVHKSIMAVLFVNAFFSSRMQYPEQSTALWLLGLQVFALGRFVFISIKAVSDSLFKLIAFIYIIIPFFLVADIPWLMWTYMASVVFIMLICPLWILSLYQYKNIIEGSWDIPVIKEHTD